MASRCTAERSTSAHWSALRGRGVRCTCTPGKGIWRSSVGSWRAAMTSVRGTTTKATPSWIGRVKADTRRSSITSCRSVRPGRSPARPDEQKEEAVTEPIVYVSTWRIKEGKLEDYRRFYAELVRIRSEERRVGKGGRSRGAREAYE